MPAKEIEIEIAPDGTVTAKISGIKGPGCQVYAKQLTELLGTEVSFTPTSEFYEPEINIDTNVEEKR